MTHPLTDLVKNLLTDKRPTIDQFDVAIAIGAPNDTDVWNAYLTVAVDILVTMTNEGSLSARQVGAGVMVFERRQEPRGYATRRADHG